MTMSLNGVAKLIEEMGELQRVLGKILAYGYGDHPDGSYLRERVAEEVGDVQAALRFFLDNELSEVAASVNVRTVEKLRTFRRWAAEEEANGQGAFFPSDSETVDQEVALSPEIGSGGVVGSGVFSFTFPEDWSAGGAGISTTPPYVSRQWFHLGEGNAPSLAAGVRVYVVKYDRIPVFGGYTTRLFQGAIVGDGRMELEPMKEFLLDIPDNPRQFESHHFWRVAV